MHEAILIQTRFPVSRPCGGISGLALAGCSNQDGLLAADGRVPPCAARSIAARAEEAALRAARQQRDLAVHERRRQPRGHLRSEAGAEQVRRPAARRQGRRRRAAGQSRAADAEPVHVQEVRAERDGCLGDLSAHRRSTSTSWRFCARCTASRTTTCRRTTRCNGHDPDGFPERRVLGHLRTGIGEPEPAGVRRHPRRARRAVRRTVELERRIHAGGLSGHGFRAIGQRRSSI